MRGGSGRVSARARKREETPRHRGALVRRRRLPTGRKLPRRAAAGGGAAARRGAGGGGDGRRQRARQRSSSGLRGGDAARRSGPPRSAPPARRHATRHDAARRHRQLVGANARSWRSEGGGGSRRRRRWRRRGGAAGGGGEEPERAALQQPGPGAMGSQCCKCASAQTNHRSPSGSVIGSRGDQELGPSERVRFADNNNTVVLSLQRVTRDDVGTYSLVAKNAAGEARTAFDLRLLDDAAAGGGDGEAPVFLRRLSDLAVKVGTRTRFLVEIRSSSDVQVAWHRNDERVLEGERFAFLHEGHFFCVDVAPVVVEDGGRWTCMAENAAGRSSCSSYLNVLVPKAYKAPEFVEELRALLTEQGTVSLECKVVGVPTPALRWYKDGREIRAGDVFALSADPADPTALGTYTCEASNCMGRTYSSSRVHVVGKGSREGSLQPADSLVPSGPAPAFVKDLLPIKCKIGEPVTLTCQVRVPPWPKAIAWYNREGRVEASEKYHVMEDGLGGYMVEINPVEAVDEGEWKCVATSNEGAAGISTTHVQVAYPKSYRKPRFLESLKAILTEEGLVSFECKVVGSPTPQLRWFKDGQELRPGDVYQLTGTNTLGSYSCIARNCMGEATSSAELTVEDIQSQLNEEERLQLFTENQPPKFVQGLKSGEGRIGEDFRLTPTVAWYRDDENVVDSDRYHLSREHLGTCHLDIRPLEIADQAEWKCVATNEFGHSVTSCFLKLHIPKHYKKPRFLECLRAILSEEGAVNLECKVIGVPQPVLRWYKDGEELKPGDIHRIISGQDGTCCLGTYTCEARNCMGTVASSASLLGFEAAPPGAGHPIARNPSLSTIHEERTSQMYEPATERSITAEERPEISFSFDGREVSVSLYETPDLTEEEALQVVEMYAEQLSEHLPPMRFVKESSHSGKILMEAVVIDVTGDYFSAAEDDLRTERDVDELSISDDSPHTAALPDDDDGLPFDKLNADFLERALAPLPGPEEPAPRRPPRRRSEGFHPAAPKASAAAAAVGGSGSPDSEEDMSFSDARASVYDTFASAKASLPRAKEEAAYQVAAIEERLGPVDQSTKSSPAELVRQCAELAAEDRAARPAKERKSVSQESGEAQPPDAQPTRPPKGVKRRGSTRVPSGDAAVGTEEGAASAADKRTKRLSAADMDLPTLSSPTPEDAARAAAAD
ncbi:Obscurin, partial [Gryllus bimaculatus]